MQRWSLDFMGDQLVDHRRFRVLNIVDDRSRFCPGQIVDVAISGARLARYLDELAVRHGLLQEIVLDNGPEGTSRAMSAWSERTGVRLRFIEPGKPIQNAFVESFNGTVLNEFFQPKRRETFYDSVDALQADLDAWLHHYNRERPHLGYRNQGRRPWETVKLFVRQGGLEDTLPFPRPWPTASCDLCASLAPNMTYA